MRQPGCHLSSLGCKLNRHEGTLVPSPLQYIRTSDPPERQLITGHCNACDTEPHAQAKRLAARIGAQRHGRKGAVHGKVINPDETLPCQQAACGLMAAGLYPLNLMTAFLLRADPAQTPSHFLLDHDAPATLGTGYGNRLVIHHILTVRIGVTRVELFAITGRAAHQMTLATLWPDTGYSPRTGRSAPS